MGSKAPTNSMDGADCRKGRQRHLRQNPGPGQRGGGGELFIFFKNPSMSSWRQIVSAAQQTNVQRGLGGSLCRDGGKTHTCDDEGSHPVGTGMSCEEQSWSGHR